MYVFMRVCALFQPPPFRPRMASGVPIALCSIQRLHPQAAFSGYCLPSHLQRRVCDDRSALGLDGAPPRPADGMRRAMGVALLAADSVQVLTHSNIGLALPNSAAKIAFLRAGSPLPGLLFPVVDAMRLAEPLPVHSKFTAALAGIVGQRGLWKTCAHLSDPSRVALLQSSCSRGPRCGVTSVAAWLGTHALQGGAAEVSSAMSCLRTSAT